MECRENDSLKERNEQRRLEEINRPMNSEFFNNLEKQYQELAKIKAENEQIEEMALIMCGRESCKTCIHFIDATKCAAVVSAKKLYNAGYRKQSEGEWILTGTFKSTFPLPVADLHEACSVCRWIPPKYSADYKKYNFCPNCGAKMKGDAE